MPRPLMLSDKWSVVVYYRATLSAASSREHVHKLWQSSDVCCCLVSEKNPLMYWVQVCVRGRPFLHERVNDPDEAANVAEKFWTQYADAQKKH
jgi:hypothetical protein